MRITSSISVTNLVPQTLGDPAVPSNPALPYSLSTRHRSRSLRAQRNMALPALQVASPTKPAITNFRAVPEETDVDSLTVILRGIEDVADPGSVLLQIPQKTPPGDPRDARATRTINGLQLIHIGHPADARSISIGGSIDGEGAVNIRVSVRPGCGGRPACRRRAEAVCCICLRPGARRADWRRRG